MDDRRADSLPAHRSSIGPPTLWSSTSAAASRSHHGVQACALSTCARKVLGAVEQVDALCGTSDVPGGRSTEGTTPAPGRGDQAILYGSQADIAGSIPVTRFGMTDAPVRAILGGASRPPGGGQPLRRGVSRSASPSRQQDVAKCRQPERSDLQTPYGTSERGCGKCAATET